jgi:sugar (pentulose or hexulose) kinase
MLFERAGTEESQSFVGALFPGIHPLDGRFGLMTVVPYGGNSLRWFREVFRPGVPYEVLNAEAEAVAPGSEGLLFVPISGSQSGRGGFLGLDGSHTAHHFARAVFEGVVFSNRLHLDLLRRAGAGVERLVMTGGGAGSAVWPRVVADACEVTVDVPDLREAACAGAAVLAGTGAGVFHSLEAGCRRITGDIRRLEPAGERAATYREQYGAFCSYLEKL